MQCPICCKEIKPSFYGYEKCICCSLELCRFHRYQHLMILQNNCDHKENTASYSKSGAMSTWCKRCWLAYSNPENLRSIPLDIEQEIWEKLHD